MKYAFMSFSCPELGLEEMLCVAKRMGYDAVEPRIEANHKHGIELEADRATRARIKAQVAEAGVPLCCVATSRSYADPAKTGEQTELTHRCIDLAADVGAPRLRVFGGMLPDGLSREAAVDLVASSLRAAADHAAERDVVLCVETHDGWCNPQHLAAVMRRADHSAVAVNWDIMHPVRAGGATMDEAFEALRPWIRHVHFHDGADTGGQLKLLPIGEGSIDHRRAVRLLMADGYDGYLSGEWIGWEPHETHLPRELATMKSFEREA